MTEQEEIKRRLLRLAFEEENSNCRYFVVPGTKRFEKFFEMRLKKSRFSAPTLERALDLALEELVELRTAYMADMSPVHEDEPDDREWEEQAP